MVKEIPEKEAAQLCREIAGVEGVKDVMWISDFNVAGMPLAMLPDQLTERFYRDGNAEYTLTIDEEYSTRVLDDIRALTDRETCFSGSFVDSKVIQATARKEVLITVGIVIIFAAVLLSFTMSSFYEVAALILCLIGSVLLNNGTNIIRRTISSMTNTAASVLQMGVSVDYSIFLLHRYDIYRRQMGKEDAMIEAMCTSVTSVFSSSVTTIIGFTALVFMRYRIGLDMGIVLAKGVLLSLLTAFTLLPCVILGLDDLIQKHHHTPYGERSLRIRTLSSRVKYAAMGIFVIATVISAGLQTFNSYYYGMSHLYKDSHAVMTERREIRETFGNENTMVLLVPSGHEPEEQIMMDEIRKMRSFIRATSLTELLGTGIPANMIPDSYRDLLQSDKYDRIILYFDLEEEDEQTFNAIDEIKAHASYHFGDDYHLIGNSVSTYDLKTVISADNIRINFITGSAVFFILVVTFRSLIIPLILTLCIEGSAWICMASSLLMRQTLFYIGYLVVTSILLGCTVDYAILVTSRYIEIRLTDQRD
ncbi:MAG: MMPL family transporter, partial [Mogibacterium sp.]|nr:MMPL family transporter [Mogibacterium sp.]